MKKLPKSSKLDMRLDTEAVNLIAEELSELAVVKSPTGNKWPNKQESRWIQNARRNHFANRVECAQKKREATKNWVGIAVGDLKMTRDDVVEFGDDDHIFTKIIAKLEEVKADTSRIGAEGV